MRNLRFALIHWYTYRSVVGVVLGALLALFLFGAYQGYYLAFLNIHPEDRLFPAADQPAPDVLLVGIDNQSLDKSKGVGQHFPFTRDVYARAIDNLVAKKVSVIVLDVGFSEPFTPDGDKAFHDSLVRAAAAGVPVVLAYGQDSLKSPDGSGKVAMDGLDQLPLRYFRCGEQSSPTTGDESAACSQPIAQLGATAVTIDDDGVVRRVPMFVQPSCAQQQGSACPSLINPLAFVAYTDYFLGKDAGSVKLQSGSDGLHFGQAWKQPLWVDSNGAFVVSYSGAPGNLKGHNQYLSFVDAYRGSLSDLSNKVALIGAYDVTGLHDQQLVPTAGGAGAMWGVEIHANILSQFILQVQKPTFVAPYPPALVLLLLLALSMLLGLVVSRLSVIWGAAATAGLLVAYTLATIVVAPNLHLVPDLVHVWLAIALTYTGVTAYRFLYEDREKRKVTAIFGQYLKPELVKQLASVRSLNELLLGGERRELTMFFVDIRGFTSMSETMQAEDVLAVTGEYLTDLTRLIFKWDGTVDKYVGDEIVAIWNAPHEQADHALLAVRCAYDIISHAPELQKRLLAMNLPPIRYGIGINTGPAVVGNMGSPMRRQYTALGDTVNTAARFCGAAGPFELLIGESTYEYCKDLIAVELAPGIQLKGKTADTFKIYKVIAIRETPQSPWVPFPTEMATQTTYVHTQQYRTQQTMLSAGATVAVETGNATQGAAPVAGAAPPAAAAEATPTLAMPASPRPPQDPVP